MKNISSNDIQAILQRVISGHASQAEQQAIVDAIQAGQVTLASGDRSVSIGGNAPSAIVITGDNTVIVQGQAADQLQANLSSPSHSPPQSTNRPTGSQKRRLEQRYNTLQSEFDLRNEKLDRLKTALAIETAESVKFQLEKQIQAEEAKLAEISDELDTIERSLS
jgi:CII-binding regulator of phage lambda lysogenization HflD